jgi:nicotinic acid mononucleotide adenylyltransferase
MYYQKYLKYKQKYLSLVSSLQQKGGARGRKIVLFGISANPPTLSHIEIVKQLSLAYDHVVVWTSTNPYKTDIYNSMYDPHYLPEPQRVEMFRTCVLALDLPNVVFLQEYSEIYSGVSICRYITANLNMIVGGEEERVGSEEEGISIPFKQFTVKSDIKDVKLADNIGNIGTKCELWTCFGKDVVADTPGWTHNNLFLTLATGIVMIDRNDGNDYADPKFKGIYNIFVNSERGEITIKKGKITETYFTMPCINISKERKIGNTLIDTKELVIQSMDQGCIGQFPDVVPENITTITQHDESLLCIVEKKTFKNLGNNSSSRVRNYMMLYHLTTDPAVKTKIHAKLLEMVPESVLSKMICSNLYTIPPYNSSRDVPESKDPLSIQRTKILEKFKLLIAASNEEIIAKIYEKEPCLL